VGGDIWHFWQTAPNGTWSPSAQFPDPDPQPWVRLTVVPPDGIQEGDTARLDWSSGNATELTLEPDIGPVAPAGTRTVTPTWSTEYRLTGVNGPCAATEAVTVHVESATGTLRATYQYDHAGSDHEYTVTAFFRGELEYPTGEAGGRRDFSESAKRKVFPSEDVVGVECLITGLARGTWKVVADSSVGAAVQCRARVPGTVTLSVAGGKGPHCSAWPSPD
jgi:hypothetical protein